MTTYQLAQVNLGRIRYPVDDPRMHGFMSRLDEINAVAEASDGFVWRLVGEGNDATSIRPFPDDMLIINMSVWDSAETLHTYTYKSAHAALFKDRKLWFESMREAYMVMWWIPAGNTPTVVEAAERLAHLREHGATPYAFTFRDRFSAEEMRP